VKWETSGVASQRNLSNDAITSYENNEPQRRRERREKKNLRKSVSSVDKFSFILVSAPLMGNSYENNEPQRRRERREKKNLRKSVSSVDKFSFILVSAPLMGNSCENKLRVCEWASS
jgi:hypothetical protein